MKKKITKKQKEEQAQSLDTKLRQLQSDVQKITMEQGSGKLHDTMLLSKKRREIARVLTMLRQKELQNV